MSFMLRTAAQSLHNKGKFQFNFWFQWFGSNAFPFIDAVKQAQVWVYGGTSTFVNNGWVSPEFMDANGYPTQIQTGGYTTVTSIPPTLASGTNLAKPGPYVLRWEGTGTLWVTGNADQTGTNGRFVFTPTSTTSIQQLNFGVRSMDSVDYIKKISIYALSDEPAYLAGEIWNPDFIARLTESKPGVLRMMDWLANNTSHITTWATRKPVDYFSQAAGTCRASWFKGAAALTGAMTYTLSTGDSLVDKMIYQIQYGAASTYISSAVTFTGNTVNWTGHPNANGDLMTLQSAGSGAPSNTRWSSENLYVINSTTDSFQLSLTPGGAAVSLGTPNGAGVVAVRLPTLSIDGGTTKRAIRNQYGDPLQTNLRGFDPGGRHMWATIVYDDTLKCWLNNGTTNDIAGFFAAGTSPELILDLLIKVKAHPWINFPFLALDPMTDYVEEFVTYIKNNAPFWMIPRYEPPNELWNSAGGFYATRYAWNIAWTLWGVQFGTHEWYGKIASTIGQKIWSIYGSPELNGDQYHMIVGFQTASISNLQSLPAVERLRSTAYLNQAAAAQSGYTKIAAHYLATHMAIANYFNPTAYRTGTAYTGSITSNVLTTTARLGDSNDNPKVGDKLYYGAINGEVTITAINTFDSNTRLGTYAVSSTANAGSQTIIGGADTAEAVRAYKYAQGDTSQLAPYLATAAGAADGQFNLAQNRIYVQNTLIIGRAHRNRHGYPKRVTFYEGGLSPDETGTVQVNTFRAASKNHADAEKLINGGTMSDGSVVAGNFNDCVNFGGEYPSQYLFCGRNVWSALDPSIYVAPDPAIWNGIKAFNGV